MSHKHNLWNQTLNSKGILGLKSGPFFPDCHRLHLLEELLYSLAEKKIKEVMFVSVSSLEKELWVV